MKRLDNRGFAITTIVYSLLLLATFVIFMMLKNTVKQRDMDDDFIKTVETQLNQAAISGT